MIEVLEGASNSCTVYVDSLNDGQTTCDQMLGRLNWRYDTVNEQ